MFGQKSDEEFIEHLKRQSARRRKLGVGVVLSGVAIAVVSAYFTIQIQGDVMALADTLLNLGSNQDRALLHAANLVAYSTGVRIGIALASGAFIGGASLSYGAYLLWGYRKERLLLHYHEKAKNNIHV